MVTVCLFIVSPDKSRGSAGFTSATTAVGFYVVTLRRGRPRPREQLLQNYKA